LQYIAGIFVKAAWFAGKNRFNPLRQNGDWHHMRLFSVIMAPGSPVLFLLNTVTDTVMVYFSHTRLNFACFFKFIKKKNDPA
jgi:hypothetical protein